MNIFDFLRSKAVRWFLCWIPAGLAMLAWCYLSWMSLSADATPDLETVAGWVKVLSVMIFTFVTLFAIYPAALEARAWVLEDRRQKKLWPDMSLSRQRNRLQANPDYNAFLMEQGARILNEDPDTYTTDHQKNVAVDKAREVNGDMLLEYYQWMQVRDLPHPDSKLLVHYPGKDGQHDHKRPIAGSWFGRMLNWLSLWAWMGVLLTLALSSIYKTPVIYMVPLGAILHLGCQYFFAWRKKIGVRKLPSNTFQAVDFVDNEHWYTFGMIIVFWYVRLEALHKKRAKPDLVVTYSTLKDDGTEDEAKIDLATERLPESDPDMPDDLISDREYQFTIPQANVETLDNVPTVLDIEGTVSLLNGRARAFLYEQASPLKLLALEMYKETRKATPELNSSDVVRQSDQIGVKIAEALRVRAKNRYGVGLRIRILNGKPVARFAAKLVEVADAAQDAKKAVHEATVIRLKAAAPGEGLAMSIRQVCDAAGCTNDEERQAVAKVFLETAAASVPGNRAIIIPGLADAIRKAGEALAAYRGGKSRGTP